MELNEEQINRLLAIIDSKVTQAVATKLSSLIPDSVQQTTTAFEQIFMQGYTVGAPLQQGTFREFLRRCKLDTLTYTGADGITITRNNTTGVVTISGLTLQTAIALCSTLAFKTITVGSSSIIASSKDDTLILKGGDNVQISLNATTKTATIGVPLGSTQYGGDYSIWKMPEKYAYVKDEIKTDKYYQLKYVNLQNTPTVDFSIIGFPKNEFIISCSSTYDITADLSNAGITVPQTNIKFYSGNLYRFVISRVYDVVQSQNDTIAYAEKIEL